MLHLKAMSHWCGGCGRRKRTAISVRLGLSVLNKKKKNILKRRKRTVKGL